MVERLLPLLLVLPLAAAAACRLSRHERLRGGVIVFAGISLAGASLALVGIPPTTLWIGPSISLVVDRLMALADMALLVLFIYYGRRYRSLMILLFSMAQLLLMVGLETLGPPEIASRVVIFRMDGLSRVMLLVVNLVGPLICCHGIAYMRNHEQHLGLSRSLQPRFFAVMLLFIGAMNGLVLANHLNHVYFFFELTTLCSFLLIGHDRTAEAVGNAVRALWINSLGGAAFALALVLIRLSGETLDLFLLLANGGQRPGALLLPLALLCLAAFVKSAQLPFQRWLLGAMVAPTPVSALLHASTMVKVGIYLVLRLSPLVQDTFLNRCIAAYGAFVFLAAAALAVGQGNGKKVLAYSTVSNLGLIFACIGMATPPALSAAVYLMIFHAVTKALLFLCVGTIEQHIHSRDIEDMRGLYAAMPVTALMTVAGVLMMIVPPFGMLLGKWMAMESAARNIEAIMLVVPGSALTVIYWARWAGLLMSEPVPVAFRIEPLPLATWTALLTLCAGGAGLSAVAPWLYDRLVRTAAGFGAEAAAYIAQGGVIQSGIGSFAVFPLSFLAVVGCLISVLALRHADRGRPVSPYLCGEQTVVPNVFCGPMDRSERATAENYYLTSIFGEATLTAWLNTIAIVLIVLFIGGAL